MTLDAKARATAFKLLNKLGKVATLESVVLGAYDPATGDISRTVTVHPIKLYFERVNKQDFEGGQVVQSDEAAIFPALGLSVEPKINDTITADGKTRLVKAVIRTWSGEQVALWRCIVTS